MTLFNPGTELASIGIISLALGFATPVQASDRPHPDLDALLPETSLEAFSAETEQARLEKLRHLQATAIARPNHSTDGVYLYGQQALPDQPATAYLVFESQAEAVTGAFYMPNSSFDCVQGQMSAGRMSLEVTDSYTQETHSYALGLNSSPQTVANRGEIAPIARTIPPNLEGYYPLPVSNRDREILATCQTRL